MLFVSGIRFLGPVKKERRENLLLKKQIPSESVIFFFTFIFKDTLMFTLGLI